MSVVVATYNRDALLRRAVESLFAQVCDVPMQIIVSDNSGSSRITDWLDRTAHARRPVSVVPAADAPGPSHARNKGAAVAVHEYLAFLDDDAEAEPDWVNQITACFDAHCEIGILAGRVGATRLEHPLERSRQFLYDSRHAEYTSRERTKGIAERFRLQRPYDYFLADYFTASNAACRSSVFGELGGFDATIRHGQDHDLAIRCLHQGHAVAYVPAMRTRHEHGRSYRRFVRQTFAHGVSTTQRIVAFERRRPFTQELWHRVREARVATGEWIRAWRRNDQVPSLSTRAIMATSAWVHVTGVATWGIRARVFTRSLSREGASG